MKRFERFASATIANLIVGISRTLLWVDRKRKQSRFVYELGVVVVVTPAAYLAWKLLIRHLFGAPVDNLFYQVVHQVFHFLAAAVTAFVFSVLFKAILPWILYLPYAAEMRALGLLRISTQDGGLLRLLEDYVKQHDRSQPIKVICISGRHLFREPRPPAPRAPLHDFAANGNLQVVMPEPSPLNPTIVSRHAGYADYYRKAVYPKIDDLVREVDSSVQFLTSTNNTVTRHHVVCTWRVVILSHLCVVQNYFPNQRGLDSDTAPVFVFENKEECDYSYYQTFSTMFELIKKYPGAPAAETGSR